MRAGIRSRPWAGLDVGSFSVKLMAMHGTGAAARHAVAETALPTIPEDPHAPPSAETVARAVAECMSHVGLSPRGFRGITMGISGADVIVKQISLPLLDDAEVGSALRFEARKHLPFDPQGMIIDFQILGRYLSEKRLDVLLAAVSREHLENHLAPLRLLDVAVDIVDPTPLALTNALVQGDESDRDSHVLLDIGHTSSHLMLYQRGEPYFSRRLDFGGQSLTRAIAENTRVPYDEAEEWKLAAGSETPSFRVDWQMPEMQAIHDCLRRDLAEEVMRSFAFYRTLGTLPDPLRLRLSGGTTRLPGLAQRLSEMIGTAVQQFAPPERSGLERHMIAGPQFAQAYGLALRSA